jgi:hypothetical protein
MYNEKREKHYDSKKRKHESEAGAGEWKSTIKAGASYDQP